MMLVVDRFQIVENVEVVVNSEYKKKGKKNQIKEKTKLKFFL